MVNIHNTETTNSAEVREHDIKIGWDGEGTSSRV